MQNADDLLSKFRIFIYSLHIINTYYYNIAEIIISHSKMPVNEQKISPTNVRDRFFRTYLQDIVVVVPEEKYYEIR